MKRDDASDLILYRSVYIYDGFTVWCSVFYFSAFGRKIKGDRAIKGGGLNYILDDRRLLDEIKKEKQSPDPDDEAYKAVQHPSC